MWLLYLILAIASSRNVVAFPQDENGGNAEVEPVSNTFVDGFIFDGPVNGRFTRPEDSTTARITTSSSTTTATTTTTSAVDPQFDNCVRVCPTTPEYNPVCGTDNVDYDNPGQLSCAVTCGKQDISINYYGKCSSKIRVG
ncbi:PREDICTED: uncharacterized protein LOC108554480 [Eufriesea mexicana]|uniref:uncharacterized protein LOC108554480 n=1 Tax=Eufriesea mexicana TaxID=516756 RepID=UPI00083C2A21|nr:PREDICTED: uncharacterized protein LOC108554480 [Eufriesea mexicana]